MGRPRTPDAIHKLQGTKPHPSTAKTQSDIPAARPKMPSHLSPEARKAWHGLVKLLEERGTLSRADSMCLSIWAETQARWIAAKAELAAHGIVIEVTVLDSNGAAVITRKPNHALRTVEQCEKNLRAMAREFGCTPQSRERVKPAKPPAEDKEPESTLTRMMRERKEKEGGK
jgi:P27 family predicted phage terminase small subunit